MPAAKRKASKKPAAKRKASKPFKGVTFVFTGKFGSGDRRKTLAKIVKSAGGSVASSLSSKVDYLIVGDEGSARYGKDNKVVRAKRMQREGHSIEILREGSFFRMLNTPLREVLS
jgi:NAD-dependent DNA ligase